MQITRQTEYAIRTALELSTVPFGEFIQTKAISERHNIPEVFLKKTIQLLSRAGLVTTQRGSQGGVRLARPSDKITLADILVAIEGPLALNVCLAENYQCHNLPNCRVHQIMKRAQKSLLRELSEETLSDIAGDAPIKEYTRECDAVN
ncbi:Rrf2 family transcriptional regulator [Desulfocucumis palustris]|uniref:Rrf2 family transcriptional regulator n=1 Tax=Desulfocucumis palustris TaxID=1898651 RepID=A0A2L2XFH0_9FIRM|nr:Rrf2 family transcriptional regulator [Desulfocucumis palustris]GBF34910.1 Rrf2 family transcriptional regulator [Desulfocucumis palustris]